MLIALRPRVTWRSIHSRWILNAETVTTGFGSSGRGGGFCPWPGVEEVARPPGRRTLFPGISADRPYTTSLLYAHVCSGYGANLKLSHAPHHSKITSVRLGFTASPPTRTVNLNLL
jgi:hypothetical protein